MTLTAPLPCLKFQKCSVSKPRIWQSRTLFVASCATTRPVLSWFSADSRMDCQSATLCSQTCCKFSPCGICTLSGSCRHRCSSPGYVCSISASNFPSQSPWLISRKPDRNSNCTDGMLFQNNFSRFLRTQHRATDGKVNWDVLK